MVVQVKVGAVFDSGNALRDLTRDIQSTLSRFKSGKMSLDVSEARTKLEQLNKLAAKTKEDIGLIGKGEAGSRLASDLVAARQAGASIGSLPGIGNADKLKRQAADAEKLSASMDKFLRTQREMERTQRRKFSREQVEKFRDAAKSMGHMDGSRYDHLRKAGGEIFDVNRKQFRNMAEHHLTRGKLIKEAIDRAGLKPGGSNILSAAGRFAGRDVGGVLPGAIPGQAGSLARQTASEISGAGGLRSRAGMGRLALGGVAGLGLGALWAGSKVLAAKGAAESEAVETSKLRYSLGGVGVDFDKLRSSVQLATRGMGVAHNEAIGFARQYAKEAGGGSESDIGSALRTSFSMAAAMGVANGSTVDFFGKMRHSKVTQDESGDRRIAAHIGDAIG